MFRFFENRLDFYPAAEPALPPRRLVPFVWACTQGMRGLIALLTVLAALRAASDALLFALLARRWPSAFRCSCAGTFTA